MRLVSSGELGRRLRAARKQAGSRQADFASRLQVSQSTVCGWERGQFRPSSDLWAAVAAACGSTVADLFFDRDEPSAAANS